MVDADSADDALVGLCSRELFIVGYMIGVAAMAGRKSVAYPVDTSLPSHVSESLVRYLTDQLKMRNLNLAWKSYYTMQISWE